MHRNYLRREGDKLALDQSLLLAMSVLLTHRHFSLPPEKIISAS